MMPCASGMRNRRGRGLPSCGLRRDGADFEEAETEPRQAVDVVAVLVQPGGEADRIRELETHRLDRARRHRLGQAPGEAGGIQEGDAVHADAVGGFGVEGEEEFADEWIEHGRQFYRIAVIVRRRDRSTALIAGNNL